MTTAGTTSGESRAGLPPRGRLAHAAGLVSFGTLLSRLLGLVREQLFAVLFGASDVADAFVVAFRIPNLLRDLFAEGALSAAFVPTFTDYLANRSRDDAFRLANRLTTTLTVVLSVVVLVAFAGSEQLVAAIASGFAANPAKEHLAATLTRVMLPFLPLVSLAAIAMGMLNALGRFFVPAFAPACFNVVAIVTGGTLWWLGLDPRVAVIGWAAGALLGGAAQFIVQVPALRSLGWRFRPELDLGFREPGMRRMALLMGPAAAGLAATQVNIFVNTVFASWEPGAAAWLNYAFRFMQLPLGLFGVAIGTIATAALARRAAERDREGMRTTLVQSLRLSGFLTIPATIGLLVLARPIIRLVYEHGRFLPSDTEASARALLCYGVGLFAYASIKVLAPAFYALSRPRVPLVASVAAVATNIAFNVALFPSLGYCGLALGTSLAALVNAGILAFAFERACGGLGVRALMDGLLRIAAASLPMGLVAYASERALEARLGTTGHLAQTLTALVPILLGIGVYAAGCRVLRLPELGDVQAAILRRRAGDARSAE